ncbi:MAG: SLATT domain-containing protein [Syntrophales bacterium]
MNELITTAEVSVSLTKEAIIKEAKRIEENCLYTSKGHYSAASCWDNFHLIIGVPTAVLAVIGGILSFSLYNIIAGILSIIVAILTSLSTFLNPKERASNHFMAANNYDSLLTKARIFWSIECKRENSLELLESKLNDLSGQRERLNRDCSQVPHWAYERAKQGIANGEASYIVDKE